ncbi:DNA polymerase phi-domain-containing protein [Phycomyces nitens]|nr:DNA polymerase phi-domain-containing protein [Phycomyces nitens]
MATTTLQLYWDLASFDPSVRQTAAQSLILALTEFQQAHEKSLDDPTTPSLADTEEKLDLVCASDVSYAVRRLLRGLPSSRQGARQGFSLALTELLSTIDLVTAKVVLDLLFRYTERVGSMSGEEVRDMLFGRLFGLMSIVASGMMARETTTAEDANRIIESLAEMAETKSYLSEVCHHVVINMLPYLKSVDYKESAVEKILELFLKGSVATVDQLNLALAIQKQLPETDLTAQFSGWKSTNVFDPANLRRLAIIVKEVPVEDQEAQADWKPQLHSVWDRLLSVYLDDSDAETEEAKRPKKKQKTAKVEQKTASFQEFWNVVVDETMFDNTASHGRKFWGFQLVEKVLPQLAPEQMPLIFTENFMRTFINNLSSDVRFLNKAAKHTATVLQTVAQENKQVGFALVTQLIGKHGHQNFDKITKTKLVENLLATMDTDGIKSYLEFLAETFVKQEEMKSDDDSKRLNSRREWALTQMTLMLTNTKIPKDESWVVSVIRFLMVHSFFEVKGTKERKSFLEGLHKPSPALSDATREFCKERFQAALVALGKMPQLQKIKDLSGAALKTRRLNGITNDGELWVYRVYQIKQELEKDTKQLKPIVTLSKESVAINKEATDVVEKLRTKIAKEDKKSLDSVERGFEILFLNLQLHLLVDEEEAQSVLGELLDCYAKIFAKKPTKSKKSKKAAAAEEEAQPEPIEVIVDILVGFLTNPSPVLKNLADQIFEIFSHMMTKQALQTLLNILATSESKTGAEELFGDNENEEEDEEMEMDSDVEMIEEDDEEEMDEDLKRKVEEAMKAQGILGDDDDEEADLDDEAMVAFDDKIAEVFKQKKIAKTEQKDLQHNIIHFKNNVMGFITIYVRKNPTNPLVLEIIVPLLNIIRSTPAKSVTSQFVDKMIAFLKNKFSKMTECPANYDEETIFNVLQAVHDFARQASSKELSETANNLSLYLRRCILGGADVEVTAEDKKKEQTRFLEIYSASLKEYMTKKSSHFHPSMITNLLQRFPLSSWPLLDSLVAYISPSESANAYRQNMACQWVIQLLQRVVGKKHESADAKFLELAPELNKRIKEAQGALKEGSNSDVKRTLVKLESLVNRLSSKLEINVQGSTKKIDQI